MRDLLRESWMYKNLSLALVGFELVILVGWEEVSDVGTDVQGPLLAQVCNSESWIPPAVHGRGSYQPVNSKR